MFLVCINVLTGKSCRTKVTTQLAKQFTSPAIAEQHFIKILSSTTVPLLMVASNVSSTLVSTQPVTVSIQSDTGTAQTDTGTVQSITRSIQPAVVSTQSVIESTQALLQTVSSTNLPSTPILLQSLLQSNPSSLSGTYDQPHPQFPFHPKDPEAEVQCTHALVSLTLEQQFKVLYKLFSLLVHRTSKYSIPGDFLELVANGMAHLRDCNCCNVIYLMCQALGTMKPDQSDTLLPAKRMPMGLIEYMVKFLLPEI